MGQVIQDSAAIDIGAKAAAGGNQADALALAVAGHMGKTSGAVRMTIW